MGLVKEVIGLSEFRVVIDYHTIIAEVRCLYDVLVFNCRIQHSVYFPLRSFHTILTSSYV
jgi:hypothetical protein